MIQPKHRRFAFFIALIAVTCAIVLMLIPHGFGADHGAVLAILPILFIGLVAPLILLSWLVSSPIVFTPDAPALPASFQRPPPFLLA